MTFPRMFKPGVRVSVANTIVDNRDGEGPRVGFKVLKSMASEPDTCEVSVYNLSDERRQSMISDFSEGRSTKVALGVGYDGLAIGLFGGDVRRVVEGTARGTSDRPLTFVADDSGEVIGDSPINASTIGMTARDMVDVALAAFARTGTNIDEHPSVNVAILAAPLEARASLWTSVAIGQAWELLDEAARVLSVRWFVREGVLFFARRGLPVDGIAIKLPRSHWLSYPSADGDGIWRLDTLLDPSIVPGRQVILIGRRFAGGREVLRVESCAYFGDTNSGPWRASIVARRSLGG